MVTERAKAHWIKFREMLDAAKSWTDTSVCSSSHETAVEGIYWLIMIAFFHFITLYMIVLLFSFRICITSYIILSLLDRQKLYLS